MTMFRTLSDLRTRLWSTMVVCGIIITAFLVVAVFVNATPGAGRAHSFHNLLRIHVIPHSDDPAEQRVKLHVRDVLLQEMSTWSRPTSLEALEATLIREAGRLETLARRTLEEAGVSHPVRVEVGDFEFDERRLDGVVFPGGTYRAVRVVIGAGAGSNWWCVLFPPLCFVDDDAVVVMDGDALGTGIEAIAAGLPVETSIDAAAAEGHDGVRVRWRLWEFISQSAYAEAIRELLVSKEPADTVLPGSP